MSELAFRDATTAIAFRELDFKRVLGISIREGIFLEKYVEEVELRELEGRLKTLKERTSSKLDPETVAKLVREKREGR